MLEYAIYLFYRAATWLLALFPLPVLFAIGQTAGTIAWLILPQYRALALRNVRIAFGNEISNSEQRRVVRRHFQQLGANLLCSIKFAEMPIEKILERVRVENFEHIDNSFRRGRPLVLLLSHVGSWELCARIFPHFVRHHRKSTIYQRIKNRYIDRHVREARSRFGVKVFDRAEGFAKPIALLRDGGGVAVLCDQHAGDGGIWTPFFARLASTTPLPALLAKRTGAQVSAFAVHTDGFARWRAIADPAIDEPDDSIESLTARSNEAVERQVRRAPEDWFWVHNRWKTPTPNFLLARYKRGVFLPEEDVALKPFNILIRGPNWLGDAVMSVPAVRAIKAGRPDAHVTIAVPERIAPMWKTVVEVDDVIALRRKSVWSAARAYSRGTHFDVAVLFPNSLRSALEVFLARIPRRAGFAGHNRSWLLNQISLETRACGIVHQTYRYLELASTLGASVQPQFPAARPVRRHGTLKLGLCPGAEYGPAKRWLPERFAEVARAISAKFSVQWILFGTSKDTAIAAEIATAISENVENRIGKTTLDQLIAELRECDLLLTNDTGTMHLGALLQVPVIAIFGSTEPRKTMPLGAGHRVLRHHVECSPCFLRECPIDFRCMHAVTTGEVVRAIEQTLRG
ncbi:MAG: lipopolysaccharide heptosyltransferase II [Verrucomicrobia bacterium]|nr:lipopolysaccharide heptosyltransferase II [Verrucomicrobiota bacterium]